MLEYDFYKSKNKINTSNNWDKRYYKVLSNIKYYEYVSIVNVEIDYEGKLQKFEARQIIDGFKPLNKNIPRKIFYEKAKTYF